MDFCLIDNRQNKIKCTKFVHLTHMCTIFYFYFTIYSRLALQHFAFWQKPLFSGRAPHQRFSYGPFKQIVQADQNLLQCFPVQHSVLFHPAGHDPPNRILAHRTEYLFILCLYLHSLRYAFNEAVKNNLAGRLQAVSALLVGSRAIQIA